MSMRITENQLRNIIRDEVLNYLSEGPNPKIDFSAAVKELSTWAMTKKVDWESATRDQGDAKSLADFLSGNDTTVVMVNLQTAVESFKRLSVMTENDMGRTPPRPMKTDMKRRSGVDMLITLIENLDKDDNDLGSKPSITRAQLSKINNRLTQVLIQLRDCVLKSSLILGKQRPEEFAIDKSTVLGTIEGLKKDLENDRKLKKY
jgi:hypothetical protein